MRKWIAISLGGVAFVLGVVGGAAYWYDSDHANKIAPGVTIGGINVSGLTAVQAHDKLRSVAVRQLSRPINVSAADRRFSASPQALHLAVDLDGSVHSALRESRSGVFFIRAFRTAFNLPPTKARQPLHVSYSRPELSRFLASVNHAVNRPALDARVDFHATTGQPVAQDSQVGRIVKTRQLRREIERRLNDPLQPRAVQAKVVFKKPKVSSAQLAKRYPVILVLNRSKFELALYKSLRLVKSYRVAVGMPGRATPAGLYHIDDKQMNPSWHVPKSDWTGSLGGQTIPPGDPRNPIMARWMGFYNGAGIHGTTSVGSLGTAASHSCVRMAIPDVIDLYPRVPLHSPLYVM